MEKVMSTLKKIVFVLWVGMFGIDPAFAQFEKSEQWIPDSANMLILVNA